MNIQFSFWNIGKIWFIFFVDMKKIHWWIFYIGIFWLNNSTMFMKWFSFTLFNVEQLINLLNIEMKQFQSSQKTWKQDDNSSNSYEIELFVIPIWKPWWFTRFNQFEEPQTVTREMIILLEKNNGVHSNHHLKFEGFFENSKIEKNQSLNSKSIDRKTVDN